jgi:long-chain fatty acid transport protein
MGRRATLSGVLCAALLAILPAARDADAAGLALLEQSPRLTGLAYAGTAALAEDASMAYFNPAGITRVQGGSAVMSGYVIDLDIQLDATQATTWGQPITGAGGLMSANGGTSEAVPQFHFAQRLAEQWVAYLGVTVPFGADIDYPDQSVTRYIGTLSKLQTINVNPAIAFGPIDVFSSWRGRAGTKGTGFSFGAGFNAQHARAHFNQKFAVPTFPVFPEFDINALITANDWAFGWNAGVLYEIDESARVGVGYRSAIHYTLTGDVDLLLPSLLGPTVPGTARAGLTVPQSVTMSGFWAVTPWLEVMADVAWTEWSAYQQLSLQLGVPTLPATLQELLGGTTIRDSIYESFRDAWRGTVGVQLRPTDAWTVRFGTGFDQSPVYNANRTLRLPDGNRVLLSLGFGYEFLENVFVDFGYTHFFISDGTIDETNTTPDQSRIVGDYENTADVFGLQFTYNWKDVPWRDLPSF